MHFSHKGRGFRGIWEGGGNKTKRVGRLDLVVLRLDFKGVFKGFDGYRLDFRHGKHCRRVIAPFFMPIMVLMCGGPANGLAGRGFKGINRPFFLTVEVPVNGLLRVVARLLVRLSLLAGI